MGLDYYSSSIGIDFGGIAPGVKKIELVPDKDYAIHRINENTIALYVSTDNLNYTLIPRTDWEYQKDDKGVITLTLKEKLATRYLKLHVKYDERGRNFEPVNKATFLNEIAKMLRVYQEAESRTEEYQYDAAGNRKITRVTLAQTAEFASLYYTNSDRLKTDGKYAFAYDNAGNMIKKGNVFEISGDTVNFTTSGEGVEYWEYEYDLLNRLIKVTKNGTIVAEYAYDPEGLRVVKRAKGETTHYVFEGTEPIFEKKIVAGKSKSYVYALGKYLARVDGVIGDAEAQQYFYHTDHLGSIRVITDQAGKVVYNADYLAFGSQYTEDGDFEELHGFTGKEYDSDIGLYYFNARWYDPDLGRFISEDPVADPNNPNLYSYCGNNPVIRVDPSGKIWGILIGALLGGLDAYLCGGDFMQGFVMGAFTGALGGAVGSALQNTAWGAALAKSSGIGFSAVSGAIGGGITGELFGEGFGKGAVYGAVGGVISYGVDTRFGEYASKSRFNELIIDGLKGGLNGLARGGDFIEGFGYGFAYSAAYEYADKFGYENNTTTDVQFDFSGAKLEGGTLLASNDPNVNRQATPAQVSGVVRIITTRKDANGKVVQQKIDYVINGKTVKTITTNYNNDKMTGYTVTNYEMPTDANHWGVSGGITWAEWGAEAGVVGFSGGFKDRKLFLSGNIFSISGEIGLDLYKLQFYTDTGIVPFTFRIGPLYAEWSLVDFTEYLWNKIPVWGTKDWSR